LRPSWRGGKHQQQCHGASHRSLGRAIGFWRMSRLGLM
jgi:hypothetical protein